jgi:hypothetical protein
MSHCWRIVAGSYDGLEWRGVLMDRGVVHKPEHGYLAVTQHEQVLVYDGSLAPGHEDNHHAFYVFAQNVAGREGWLPDRFVALGEPLAVHTDTDRHPDAVVADAFAAHAALGVLLANYSVPDGPADAVSADNDHVMDDGADELTDAVSADIVKHSVPGIVGDFFDC